MRAMVWVVALSLTGCWKTDAVPLTPGIQAFNPDSGGPSGWVVQSMVLPIECPDGEDAAFYIVYPTDTPTEAMPAAIVFHSGAFDYVPNAQDGDYLAGSHYQNTSRLDAQWASRQVFVTLGMYTESDFTEVHTGTIIAALAEEGIVSVLPVNCWGDLNHNVIGGPENDFNLDKFFRNGRGAGEWTWKVITDSDFATTNQVELPVTIDGTQVYAIGLGEGGRAVGELLHAGYTPTALMVDSPPDDLTVFWGEDIYQSYNDGLVRLFPAETDDEILANLATGSLSTAPWLPDRSVYIYSSVDTQLPSATHTPITTLLAETAEGWVYDTGQAKHVFSNSDATIAANVVTYLSGAVPTEDPVDTSGGDTGR